MLKITPVTRDNEKGDFPLAGEVAFLFFCLKEFGANYVN